VERFVFASSPSSVIPRIERFVPDRMPAHMG
jgi:hypothetical protein